MNTLTLSGRLREATHAMHRNAETSRFMRRLLKGEIEAATLCILLRNLHALYEFLESRLDGLSGTTGDNAAWMHRLYRTSALTNDLDRLRGSDWQSHPLACAMENYLDHLKLVSADRSVLLMAHAYVRYMGDLSGGQLLSDIIGRTLAMHEPAGLAFFHFEGDPSGLKDRFRSMLDGLRLDSATEQDMVIEANRAFEHHVLLFQELDGTSIPIH